MGCKIEQYFLTISAPRKTFNINCQDIQSIGLKQYSMSVITTENTNGF